MIGKRTDTLRLCFLISAICLLLTAQIYAQPAIQWDKTLGGNNDEYNTSIEQTADGGYIVGGQTVSGLSGDKTEPSRGSNDYWVVKLAADGTVEWDKTLGGSETDVLVTVQQTPDGGYIAGGFSNSEAGGDKSEDNHSVPDQDGFMPYDYWVIKLSANGTKEWDKTYGGLVEDFFTSLKQTPDGGFIIGGGVSGGYNIVKLTANGSKEWERTYRGLGGITISKAITLTSDGGYFLGGSSSSGVGGDKSQPSKGGYDYWIIKISSDGSIQWEKTFGGSNHDYLSSINETLDGGYILAGSSLSGISGDKTETINGLYDAWVIKITPEGVKEWDRSLGGSKYLVDNAFYRGESDLALIKQTSDGTYVFGGPSTGLANDDKTVNNPGFWILKLGLDGMKISDDIIVGPAEGVVARTSDSGYILGRSYNAPAGGSKTENSRGGLDFWILKLASDEGGLPVKLVDFSAKKESGTALLQWKTSSETHSDHFEVQHSTNGKSWDLLGTVNAKGESNDLESYQYVHTNPALGENLYRLKMIDTDGIFAFSKINSLTFDTDLSLNMFPNPVSEILTIKIADWKDVMDVQLINSQSAIVYESAEHPKNELDVKKLSSGVYSLKITKSDGSFLSHKVVVAR